MAAPKPVWARTYWSSKAFFSCDDWKINPATQLKWGLKYVQQRYGTPCQAWEFKRGHGWCSTATAATDVKIVVTRLVGVALGIPGSPGRG